MFVLLYKTQKTRLIVVPDLGRDCGRHIGSIQWSPHIPVCHIGYSGISRLKIVPGKHRQRVNHLSFWPSAVQELEVRIAHSKELPLTYLARSITICNKRSNLDKCLLGWELRIICSLSNSVWTGCSRTSARVSFEVYEVWVALCCYIGFGASSAHSVNYRPILSQGTFTTLAFLNVSEKSGKVFGYATLVMRI